MDVIKANKKYAGQLCNICRREIDLGETIHICPNCQGINHEECWQNEGGCPKFSCNSLTNTYQKNDSVYKKPNLPSNNPLQVRKNTSSSTPPSSFNQNTVACRWCKEPIPRGSKKCPHCGEFQKDADREKAKKNDVDEDTSIPSGMWVGIFFVPDIAFIVGIVFMCKGQVTKGAKILGASLIVFIIKVAINIYIRR